LIVCPKPIVPNWLRELRLWAEDVPVEVIGGDLQARRMGWLVSNCPVKLVNYELLTRDADFLSPRPCTQGRGVGGAPPPQPLPPGLPGERGPRSPLAPVLRGEGSGVRGEIALHFDVVVLDEAQRIKNHDSKTSQVVRTIRRDRSWALTGTPIENRPE